MSQKDIQQSTIKITLIAEVAKLVDAPDLGSGAVRYGGSSPLFRTNFSQTRYLTTLSSNQKLFQCPIPIQNYKDKTFKIAVFL